ncbi:MAG: cellulase family glycosylhydrolase [Ignavibacteriaceae bacterium]
MKKSAILIFILLVSLPLMGQKKESLYVDGRYLYTPCGEKVIIRGINKMIIWTGDTTVRRESYREIRKTGANCVRIVWLANPTPGEADSGPDGLDRTIQYCINNHMIPMVELHDATGDWSKLQDEVNYWISPEIVSVVKKHERYFLLNIANECGDETVTDDQFKTGYESAVKKIRNAGIKCPLVIDASDWGKNLAQLRSIGAYLINADPEHNLLFSVHLYWAISDGANESYLTNEFQESVNTGLPFIVGEFTYKFNREGGCDYEADYKTIIRLSSQYQIGWLAWEWGPGNDYFEPTCDIMNMTADSYFNTLKDTWAKEVALTSPYSIDSTSVTPGYILNNGECSIQSVNEKIFPSDFQLEQNYPNPFNPSTNIKFSLPAKSRVIITIYDLLGRKVKTLINEIKPAGNFVIQWNGDNEFNCKVVSGIYFCGFSAEGFDKNRFTGFKKMILLK